MVSRTNFSLTKQVKWDHFIFFVFQDANKEHLERTAREYVTVLIMYVTIYQVYVHLLAVLRDIQELTVKLKVSIILA